MTSQNALELISWYLLPFLALPACSEQYRRLQVTSLPMDITLRSTHSIDGTDEHLESNRMRQTP
jgi:hypothetical protein